MLKTTTLKENSDFRRLYRKGRSYVNSGLVVYMLRNRLKLNRIGITTSKKLGKAVRRNRARRIIRESYRQLEDKMASGWDFVFVARGKTLNMKTGEILRVMTGIFIKSGVLK